MKYLVLNESDPNDTFEIEASDISEAHYLAMEYLGWWISAFPKDNEQTNEEKSLTTAD